MLRPLDFFTVLYAILVATLFASAIMSFRNQFSPLQKIGSRIILACAFVNLCYLFIYLSEDASLAGYLFCAYFTCITWFLREIFWYEVTLAEFSFAENRVYRFITWIAIALDAMVVAVNFFTLGAVTYCHFKWSGEWHFSYVIRKQFYVHLFICYMLVLGTGIVVIAKMFKLASIYRKRFYGKLLILLLILITEIYFDYFVRLDTINLSAAVFSAFAFRTYWECYRSLPNYQSYVDHFLIDRLEAGLVMFNYSDRLESFNKRAAEWFKLDDMMRGRLTREVFINKYQIPVTSADVDQAFKFRHGEDFIDGRLEILHEGALITGYFFVFYDITEEENTRISLEKYGLNRKAFISNMTHELRTPLNAIIGFSSQLLERVQRSEIRDQVSLIDKNGRLILRYIDEMKDMMTLQDDEYVIRRENFNPVDVMNGIIEKNIDLGAGSRVNFDYRLDPMTPTVLGGDPESMATVIGAVLDNAVTFTERGRITMTANWQTEDIGYGVFEVVVEDTGCGMSEEILENIYLAFSVGQELRHKHENGIGIGLYIAKRILDLMGGTIVVESHIKIGTTVTVKIPMMIVDPTPIATTQKKESITEYDFIRSNVKILIVEDDPINARSLRRQLEHFGAEAHICESGESALEYLATGPSIDLIFMDYLMPGLNGIETTNRIRLSGVAIRRIPIVAVSADAVEGRRKQFLEARMNDVLFKPFEMSQLMDILARWLPPAKISLTRRSGKKAM